MAPRGDAPAADSASRTLVLGIDGVRRVVQCGPNVGTVIGRTTGDLIGRPAADLVGDEGKAELETLLEAIGAGQERTAVLPVLRGDRTVTDAVVTAQPMVGDEAGAAAGLLFVRVALPPSERYQDPALMRRALMDDQVTRFGASLDLDQSARGLVDAVVPHFCTAASVLVLESLVAADEVHSESGSAVLRRIAVTSDDGNPAWTSAFPVGEVLVFPEGTPYREVMDTARPVHLPHIDEDAAGSIGTKWRRGPAGDLLKGVSMVLLPMIARDTLLGFIACTRVPGFRKFDAYDVEIGMEFAARAAIVIDNARLFSRERATALALQRSLLPNRLSAPSSVEVRHRYLPGSKLVEVGGDWYESIALPGARVALIVGDVAGHGVRAAVTMGRLRTALHTLANLELPPADALHVMHELMIELGEQEPHFATCVYAVYDATSGTIEIASAGHLPPLLAGPAGDNEYLQVPPAPPLGVAGGQAIESREFTVEDGSLFVIYTDGLVENRGRDIDDGLARLRGIFGPGSVERPMEDLAKATLDGVYADQHRDDIAVLIARLRRLPEDRCASWSLPADPAAVRRARGHVRTRLEEWGLEDLDYTTQLLASELITNAMRYAHGPIELRLLLERTLVCEVLDRSAALPRLRRAEDDDENGRGLLVVSQLAHRWGTRRTASGKVVWCEQIVPGVDPDPADQVSSWPGESHHRE
ncbi:MULTISPECIES: SpoIIE family protein phosphatase [Actinomadura]|uniref:protein-serine/threonine phosphatase n=1 Tax=Actinomadura litoris TaxID=2678616 RepID=A0A7K1L778_9ACTN|nr:MULTISPECIES: SpoIIE family protein phosphatase [Actinomadura]MBT2209590.1 SpoIIE family protein phosphatase [Actinomadura sp. NEAU-AAG7]MUN40280.1 SpoIIE family protein phosphatase [Actinomadura litoris]